MRHAALLGLSLLSALALPTVHAAQQLSTDAFTEAMAGAFRQALPGGTVEVVEPLTLDIATQGGEQVRVNVDRVHRFCNANSSEDCEALKATFVDGFIRGRETADAPFDRSMLRAILRSPRYVAEADKSLASQGGLVQRPFAPGLTILLAADLPTTTRLVSAGELRAAGLSEDDALVLGRQQLLATLPGLPALADLEDGLLVIDGIDYVVSLLTADGWDELSAQTRGQLHVAVPSDELLLVALIDGPANLEPFKALAADLFATAAREISPLVYRRDGGRWRAAR